MTETFAGTCVISKNPPSWLDRMSWLPYASVTVPGRVESIRLAAEFIVQAARNMHVPAASDSLFESAIVEALNNALKHGTAAQRPEALIVCELERVDHRLTVRILDQGPGFVLPPTPRPGWSADDMTTIPESGFGLQIIQGYFRWSAPSHGQARSGSRWR